MRILIIGASGTIGKRLINQISSTHELITAGRTSGDVLVDITSEASIRAMFQTIPSIDACICTAASGAMDTFSTLTQMQLEQNMAGKLMGQVNLVLIGQHYLNKGGSFTLTSGIFADHPAKGVTGGGLISGALHSFTLSAALELPNGIRINVVSPGMVEDSAENYGAAFPDLNAVPMIKVVRAYLESLEKPITGQILRVYE